MSQTDYRKLYDDYWRRTDRWGQSSFKDAGVVADQILKTCGGGWLLDVGCGMGFLVRWLLNEGVDAYGVDVSATAIDGLRAAHGERFQTGSILELPYEDDAFDTVVCTDVLEHLAEADVAVALAELLRVTRRGAFLSIATIPDRDRTWHLTVRDRDWWEQQLFAAGFRKHPRSGVIASFEMLEFVGPQFTIALEKPPRAAREQYPLATLAASRMLHMDMLRASGRRSDAHLARYLLAASLARPGDLVLDAACGLGYGAAMVRAYSQARRVIGIDADEWAVRYAECNYADPQAIEFRAGDVCDLSGFADHSIDLVIGLEMLEHLVDPDVFLREVERVLKPAGRLIVSVPNQWVDEHGEDPNPHHLHVYDWAKLAAQLRQRFQLERAFGQTAGGGLKLADQPRRMTVVDVARGPDTDAEWWLAIAMKDAVGAAATPYVETTFDTYADVPGCHLTAFAEAYDNPWLVTAMVAMGLRNSNPAQVEQMARAALGSARPGSADAGAALCVMGYRLLEQADMPADEARAHVGRIKAYQQDALDGAHVWRWRISCQFVAGRLQQRLGALDAARAAYLACAAMDPVIYSPLLATKTVEALYRAGMIDAGAGRFDAARAVWLQALGECRRVLGADWANVWGTPERPAPFGLPEIMQVVRITSRCAFGLHALERWRASPGAAWEQIHALDAPPGGRAASGADRESLIAQLRSALQERDHAQGRLVQDLQSFRDSWNTQHGLIGEQTQRIAELERERDQLWSEMQSLRKSWDAQRALIDAKDRRVGELDSERAHLWDDMQALRAAWEEQRQQISTKTARITELDAERDQLWGDLQALRESWETQRTLVGEQAARIATLDAERDNLWRDLQALRASWETQRSLIGEQAERIGVLEAERDRLWSELQTFRESWEAQRRQLGEQADHLATLERRLATSSADDAGG